MCISFKSKCIKENDKNCCIKKQKANCCFQQFEMREFSLSLFMPLNRVRDAGILAFWYDNKSWKKSFVNITKVMIYSDLSIRVILIHHCIWELLNLHHESTNTFPPKHIDPSKNICKLLPYHVNIQIFGKKLSKNFKDQFTDHSPSQKQQNQMYNPSF